MVTMGLHPGGVKLKHFYDYPIFNCVTDHSQEEVKYLLIGLSLVATLLVILGPFGLYHLCCLYKDKVHNRCVAGFICAVYEGYAIKSMDKYRITTM